MKARAIKEDVWSVTKDTVVILDVEGAQQAQALLSKKSKELGDQLAHAVSSGDFKAKDGQWLLLYARGKLPVSRVIIAGLGKKAEFHGNKVRLASGLVVNGVRASGIRELAFLVDSAMPVSEAASFCSAVVEGAMLAHHRYDVHKTEKDPAMLESIILSVSGGLPDCACAVEYASIVSGQALLARDMVTMAASDKPPRVIAGLAEKQAGKAIAVRAFFRKDLQKMGAGGILAVNRGAVHEPCILVLEYNGQKRDGPCICLVGKGIVFDSGGLDVKTAANMETMKGDLGGAAAVMHAVFAAERLRLPLRVVAVAALTENVIGPEAYKPGDFIQTLSGKTVEVLNTDAEGRIVLADALWYARSCKPDYLVDMATLTGACWIALGSEAAGLFSNNDELRDMLVEAGSQTHERVWPMPMYPEYAEYMKSDFADLKNVVSNAPAGAGAITAAKFLESFVDKRQKWAHVDMAGVDWMEQEKGYYPRGGTGFGVRLLVRFLADLAAKQQGRNTKV